MNVGRVAGRGRESTQTAVLPHRARPWTQREHFIQLTAQSPPSTTNTGASARTRSTNHNPIDPAVRVVLPAAVVLATTTDDGMPFAAGRRAFGLRSAAAGVTALDARVGREDVAAAACVARFCAGEAGGVTAAAPVVR